MEDSITPKRIDAALLLAGWMGSAAEEIDLPALEQALAQNPGPAVYLEGTSEGQALQHASRSHWGCGRDRSDNRADQLRFFMAINICACVPFGAPGFTPGTDYTLQLCPQCGRRCWVGPKQAIAIAAGLAMLRCIICVARLPGCRPDAVTVLNPACDARWDLQQMDKGLAAMDVEDMG